MAVVLTPERMSLDFSEDTAHTIEVTREVNDRGERGSFGFNLNYEKPTVVGTVVPGGPAERAGLQKDDVVLTVNGRDVRNCTHQEVVGLIASNPSASVWLCVCDPPQRSHRQISPAVRRGLGSFHLSQSSPVLPRNIMDSPPSKFRGGYYHDSPPKYQEVAGYSNGNSGMLGHRGMVSSMATITPLQRKVLTQTVPNGSGPMQNGHLQYDPYDSFAKFSSCSSVSRASSRSLPGSFTSASVLVLYIGPVEIPETWSDRGLSSKCVQECTRRLLSQRHEFIEVFLEITLSVMKVLNLGRNTLVKHRREELYYCGSCTDDEQYFAIVTRKVDPKGSQKLVIDPEVGQTVPSDGSRSGSLRADICHVFKVIKDKSVLVLYGGERKKSTSDLKPKTIPISSCVVIINAIKGLFIGDAGLTAKLFEDSSSFPPQSVSSTSPRKSVSQHNLRIGPASSSFTSVGSTGSNGSNDSGKKKKLDVVDLRPSAFNQSGGSSTPGNTYVPAPTRSSGVGMAVREFPHTMATPAFLQSNTGLSWYSTPSPREHHHSRANSWDVKDNKSPGSRPNSGGFGDRYPAGPQDMRKAKKVSDDSMSSSVSSSRTPSPAKLSFRSSQGRSRSPSIKSLSVSSGERSRSPSPVRYMPRPHTPSRLSFVDTHSKLSQGLALELPAGRAMSPTSMASSVKGSRLTHLRRQGSESSVMDAIQAEQFSQRNGMPQKNGPMSSSIGSVATMTTMEDEECDEPEELGRVAGWLASFDKLLADPLAVQCLQQFLEKEHCEENILFWRDVEEFKKNASQIRNLEQEVKKLYDKYLSPTAPHCINVDDRVQKGVEAKLSNPPLDVFDEAHEQIYQLMKMDCYFRFQRSQLAKDCMMAEVEGRPLPIEQAPQQTRPQPQYGAWKKQRSFFGRWARPRAPMHLQQSLRGGVGNWGVLETGKKGKKEGKAAKKETKTKPPTSSHDSKGKSSRSEEKGKPAPTTEEEFPPDDHLHFLQSHKGNLFEINLPNKVTKILVVPSRGTVRDAVQPVLKKHNYALDITELRFANSFKLVNLDEPASILTGQHISVIKSKNTFNAEFPDVPERILPADGRATVGGIFNRIMKESGKTQNFAVYLEGSRVPLQLDIDTSVLIGQRVVVKYLTGTAKPTGSGSSPVMGGAQAKGTKKASEDKDVDDLISMICRLASDTLEEQRTSPSPQATPDSSQTTPVSTTPGYTYALEQRTPPDMGHKERRMPSDVRRTPPDLRRTPPDVGQKERRTPPDIRRTPPDAGYKERRTPPETGHKERRRERRDREEKDRKSHPQKHSPSSSSSSSKGGSHEGLNERRRSIGEKKKLTTSKSTDLLDSGSHRQSKSSHPAGMRSTHLHPQGGQMTIYTGFSRTRSGVAISNTQKVDVAEQRAFSPPSDVSHRQRNVSPPPPSTKPPPLPVKSHRNLGEMRQSNHRWSGSSLPSTTDSDGSMTTELHTNHPRYAGDYASAHGTRDGRSVSVGNADGLRYFPGAYPTPVYHQGGAAIAPSQSNAVYVNNSAIHEHQRSASLSFQRRPSYDPSQLHRQHQNPQHPLDNFVSEAYSNAPSIGPSGYPSGHHRQKSWPVRIVDPSHPLQTNVQSSTTTGATLSNYPWQQAHQHRRYSNQMTRTARQRHILTENPVLMEAGDKIVQQEIEDYRRSSSDTSSNTSDQYRAPLSPTTHMLVVPEDENSLGHQQETFV